MSNGVSCCNSDNTELIEILLRSKKYQVPRAKGFQLTEVNKMELIRMEYTGNNSGAIPFSRVGGVKLSRTYRGGNNPRNKFADATPEDVELLVKSGKWKVVQAAQASASTPSEDNPPMPAFESDEEPAEEVTETEKEPVEILASKKVREEAEELGVNLENVTGTGKDGRITVADVRSYKNGS
jgi:hypothetical protein